MKTNLIPQLVITFIGYALLLSPSLAYTQSIHLEKISTYHAGFFDQSATEILAHDPITQRMFVTNGATGSIDIIDISDPYAMTVYASIDLSPYGKSANSVSFKKGVLVVAVENQNKQLDGKAVFFDSSGNFISQVTAGALPDNVVFSPNGKYVLVANEGEPNDAFTIDPEGSVTLIDMSHGAANLTQNDVTQLDFRAFNNVVLDASIRTNANPGNSTVAQDLEPEYITISKNSRIAWVSLQENNAIAIIDIKKGKILKLVGLGFKDHSIYGNGLDASNKTSDIDIALWPVKGMYMPDAITNYKRRGRQFIVTANEGDSRDYSGYSEEVRVKDLALDPIAFPNAAYLQEQTNIGRMKTTIATGDADGDGLFEEIYTYGARSFSIRKANGNLVYDSGDEFEQITALALPDDFNSTNDENGTFKDRSDDKGPEPEAVEVAKIHGRYYAFIGLERVGGIMVYDISHPRHPRYVQYINNRDFSVLANTPEAGDLGPEDVFYIKKKDSPIHGAILACASEVSGTITLFSVQRGDGSCYYPYSSGRVLEEELELASDQAKLELEGVVVYPNPVEDGMLRLNKEMDVVIYDSTGQLLIERISVDQVDVSMLKTGIYLLKSSDNLSVRFVVK